MGNVIICGLSSLLRRRRARMDDGESDSANNVSDGQQQEEAGLVGREGGGSEERDLAAILSYLLRSGHVRLMRGGSSGAFQVSLRRSDDALDSDDEDEHGFSTRTGRPPSPLGDPSPDVSKLVGNDIKEKIMSSSGAYLESPVNVVQRIHLRESHSLKRRSCFVHGDMNACSKIFFPNCAETVARYSAKVFCGMHSTDGDLFLSACQDQHIRLYDTTQGKFKLFRDIKCREVGWSVVDAAYSPDQNYIIYSSWSDSIHLCNVFGDHETHLSLNLRPRDSRFCAFSVCFSQDGKEILAGASDQCLYVYDRTLDDRTLRIEGHDDDVNAVAFADESSNVLLSGGDDGICKVWDRRSLSEDHPKPVGMLAGHTDGIAYVCSKNDGLHFLSNSKDQTIKLWDLRHMSSQDAVREARKIVASQRWDYRWEPVPRRSQRLHASCGNDALMTYRGHAVLHTLLRAKFSPVHTTGQKYIYAGCATGAVIVYDVLTGRIVRKLKGNHHMCVRDVSWHPFENTIMSSSWDCTIAQWQYDCMALEEFSCDSLSHLPKESSEGDPKPKRIRQDALFN